MLLVRVELYVAECVLRKIVPKVVMVSLVRFHWNLFVVERNGTGGE